MKILFICFIIFSYQRFIVENILYDSCDGKVKNGKIITPNKCYSLDINQGIYAMSTHRDDFYTKSFPCNSNCQTCRMNINHNYTCHSEGPRVRKNYYGVPQPLSSTGFYIKFYSTKDLCDSNAPVYEIDFVQEKTCLSIDSLLNIKNKKRENISQRMGFNTERNGVIIEEFDSNNDCEGTPSSTYFFPNDKCSKVPNIPIDYHIKVSKSL